MNELGRALYERFEIAAPKPAMNTSIQNHARAIAGQLEIFADCGRTEHLSVYAALALYGTQPFNSLLIQDPHGINLGGVASRIRERWEQMTMPSKELAAVMSAGVRRGLIV